VAFAQRLGWQQSRLSKIETGRQFPSPDDIVAWAGVAGADPGPLLAQLESARAEHATWAEQYRRAGGAAAKQASIGGRYETAAHVAKFQPVMIPSQLQTAEYARELLHSPSGPLSWGTSEEDVEAMVGARMARQHILYQPGKRIEVVILEAALYTLLVSPRAMAGQLDRMLALEGAIALDLGIIPTATLVPVYPTSGFVVFDSDLVVVETIGGEDQISDPDEVTRYVEWFRLLHGAAVHGRQAAGLIRAAINQQREDPAMNGDPR
jgi:hypothetical protein